jgi:hypothetical protein
MTIAERVMRSISRWATRTAGRVAIFPGLGFRATTGIYEQRNGTADLSRVID